MKLCVVQSTEQEKKNHGTNFRILKNCLNEH